MIFIILAVIMILSFLLLGNLQMANKMRILLIGMDDPFVQQKQFRTGYNSLKNLAPDSIEALKANPFSKKNWEEVEKVASLRNVAMASGLTAAQASALSSSELERRYSKSSSSSSSSGSSDSDFGGGGGFDGGGAGGDY
jgi:uncharacterized membrane protein YgcG